jgi:transcription initiation factor TFIID subunit 11
MSMTEEQLDRYEAYRRSALPRAKVKKLLPKGPAEPTPEALIALSAIGKLFVGEVVELARKLANQQGHSGALMPSHLHTAYQMLYASNKVPQPVPRKRLLRM